MCVGPGVCTLGSFPIFGLIMSEHHSSSSDSSEEPDWDWQQCLPHHGTELYVQALQILGIDMSKAVPGKVKKDAIVPLDKPITGDLIAGYFGKSTTKERVLNLSCI